MKKALSIAALILCLSANLFAQFPKVETIETKEKVFHGTIGDYPVTIYLKFHDYSNYSLALYSVKGWYYYNKYKKQIPLVGIYGFGKLTLYSIKDTNAANDLLDFRSNAKNYIEEGEYYANLEGYDEKFEIGANGGLWKQNGKSLTVSLNERDKGIIETDNYLRLDTNRLIDLSNFGVIQFYEHKIVSSNSSGIILEYTTMSNPNVMGRCGAGEEKYLMFIQFRADGLVADFGQYLVSSCNMGFEIESIKDIGNEILEYKCVNFMNETEYILKVDKANSTIKKK
jgi:hypothetical protein